MVKGNHFRNKYSRVSSPSGFSILQLFIATSKRKMRPHILKAYKDFYDYIESIFEMLEWDEVKTYWDYIKTTKLKIVNSNESMKKALIGETYQCFFIISIILFIETFHFTAE